MEIKFKHLLLATIFSTPFLSAKAELIDHSKFYIDGEKMIYQVDNQPHKWKYKPAFSFPDIIRHHITCSGEKERCSQQVILKLIIDPEGNIAGVQTLKSSGYPMLDKHSISQVRKGSFYPYYVDGKAAYVSIIIPIEYITL